MVKDILTVTFYSLIHGQKEDMGTAPEVLLSLNSPLTVQFGPVQNGTGIGHPLRYLI